ncbi:hypothetical protein RIF29_20208 [Crotalaria pallida]|uniref:Uncharacterized protein n=1 Tax=Crotalaria pallida TaxID=3830 RepID=A0AAN9I648_CROPI
MDTQSPLHAVNDNVISNLESTFSESFHIEDAQKSEHASERGDNCNMEKGDLCGGIEQQGTKLNMNCSNKCSTFPYPDMMLPPSSSDEDDDDATSTESLAEQSSHQSNSCSLSLPAPSTLVSAMKGSREKQGGSPMKLTVKWAPDVYDPIPTLSSHTVKSKKQHKSRHKSEKRSGRKGQRGWPSKGSSGKDKKHYRKPGGTSDLWWLDSHQDKVIEASTQLDDRNVVSHDSHCGTSFLKQSIAKVHYPVGEAQ